ncbi:MAG: methyltransferase domain-containing protein [Kiritimatiellia bacterium]
MNEALGESTPDAGREVELFEKNLPLRIQLHEVLGFLGNTRGKLCLDIGAENGLTSYHLRRHGGQWHSIAGDASRTPIVRQLVKDNVHEFSNDALPFEDKLFDTVLVLNFLEKLDNDAAFAGECHRILKPDGMLIVTTARTKKAGLLRMMENVFGLLPEARGLARPGYTESRLFSVLKNGFDVCQVKTYSRFFTEFVRLIMACLEKRKVRQGQTGASLDRLRTAGNIFYNIASQLDLLLFFTKGHYQVAKAKRRGWRPRETPVLTDGRSISEAVLRKAAE